MREGVRTCYCGGEERQENESMRDWLKRCLCMYHWMQTDYYKAKNKSRKTKNEDTNSHV